MRLEDKLDYLPHKPAREFAKREVVYSAQNPSRNLNMVVAGRVKITTVSAGGTHTVVRIAGPEALFGESALIAPGESREFAVALDRVAVMSWTPEELERYIERLPGLGMALSRYFVTQSMELQARIVTMATYGIPERVSMSLIQLARSTRYAHGRRGHAHRFPHTGHNCGIRRDIARNALSSDEPVAQARHDPLQPPIHRCLHSAVNRVSSRAGGAAGSLPLRRMAARGRRIGRSDELFHQ